MCECRDETLAADEEAEIDREAEVERLQLRARKKAYLQRKLNRDTARINLEFDAEMQSDFYPDGKVPS